MLGRRSCHGFRPARETIFAQALGQTQSDAPRRWRQRDNPARKLCVTLGQRFSHLTSFAMCSTNLRPGIGLALTSEKVVMSGPAWTRPERTPSTLPGCCQRSSLQTCGGLRSTHEHRHGAGLSQRGHHAVRHKTVHDFSAYPPGIRGHSEHSGCVDSGATQFRADLPCVDAWRRSLALIPGAENRAQSALASCFK